MFEELNDTSSQGSDLVISAEAEELMEQKRVVRIKMFQWQGPLLCVCVCVYLSELQSSRSGTYILTMDYTRR